MKHASVPSVRPPHRQRGAALLLAMMIVALVATLATAMVWQQWRAVQVESIERARSQASWILSGALDWSRLILREDKDMAFDHLGEIWAVPLAEARLSTFLAADKENNSDGGPEAFLSGVITDAQARFNVRNLVVMQQQQQQTPSGGQSAPQPAAVKAQVEALERLCISLNLPTSIAQQLAAAMVRTQAPTPEASTPLEPQNVQQLAWLGIDPASLERLRPYLVVLPAADTKLNVNTAPAELIAAVGKLEPGTAGRLVRSRPFKSMEEANKVISPAALDPALLDVKTGFFEARGRLRLDRRIIEETSIMFRAQNREVKARTRYRESMRELSG